MFSDESKYNLISSDGITRVRRPVNTRFDKKYVKSTVKHGGGSVNVWGCLGSVGTGPIHRINGIMDRFIYKDILQDVMLPFFRRKMPRGKKFQHDNDPKHTSQYVKNFLGQQKIHVLEWPSQSPDLNLIEHAWDYVEKQIRTRKHTNLNDLFNHIDEEWRKIPQEYIDKLFESMPRRIQAVLRSKGGPTKY